MSARLDRVERRRDLLQELQDSLSRSSLGCPRKPVSCGHMLVDHGDGWDDDGAPTNPACRVRGCDCDGIS